MAEFLVIFSITAAGSLVRWSADLVLKRLAIKEARTTVEIVSKGAWSGQTVGVVDPVVRVGFILACYGGIVLALVSAAPGAFALERTGFAFALLCAGGLVGEISGAGVTEQTPASGAVQQDANRPCRASRPLAMALALTLNFSIALLTAKQGLIPIVTLPQTPEHADRLEPVVVIAKRSHDPLEEQIGSERPGL